jgi:hypothetical protein
VVTNQLTATTSDGWTIVAALAAAVAAAVAVVFGSIGLVIAKRSLDATRDSVRVTQEAVTINVRAAETTERMAKQADRAEQRARLVGVLDRLQQIIELARRAYNMNPLTQQLISEETYAVPPLQAALVSLRTYVHALAVDLPKVKELANVSVRETSDAQNVIARYLPAVDEVQAAMAEGAR